MVLDDTAGNITTEFTDAEIQLHLRTFRDEVMSEIYNMHSGLASDLKSYKDEFRAMISEIREFRSDLVELKATMTGMAKRVDDFESRLKAVELRQAEPAPAGADVAALERRVTELKQELNERDQDALLADLEIGHLPEERGESVVHAVTVLAAKLGVPLEERDVVFAERVGAPRSEGPEAGERRVRRVVVRLARRDLRDRILQGARVRRTLTAADAGRGAAADGGDAPRIFVNERLTGLNRLLFHRVREECRRAQWRFAWTKRGRVYAREGEGKPAYPFRVEADIARIFGKASV